MNRVRREFFGSARSASTAVEVARLVQDDLLAVRVIRSGYHEFLAAVARISWW